jgi:hypothetical protein
LTGAILTAHVTLLFTVASGVTVSVNDGLASTIWIGVPAVNAKKKLAPP